LREGGRPRQTKGKRAFSRAWLFAVAWLALFSQAIGPIAHAYAQPPTTTEIAADLKATFGDAFQLCVHIDDAAHERSHASTACNDCCPLCGALAVPVALPPEGAFLSVPVVTTKQFVAPQPIFLPPPARASPAKPRAPPFEV
jgi:hypothetical protein